MKQITAKTLLFTTVLMMVFGFLGMSLSGSVSGYCPIAAAYGGMCQTMPISTGNVEHHIDGMEGLMLATTSVSPIIILTAIVFAVWILAQLLPRPPSLFFKKRVLIYKLSSLFRLKLFWSALHNKWGNIASYRVYELTSSL